MYLCTSGNSCCNGALFFKPDHCKHVSFNYRHENMRTKVVITLLALLQGHTSTVRCLAMHDNNIVSGSCDGTLRVWDLTRGECVHTLVGHSASVRCVVYDGERAVSGASDYLVKIWDVETETCVHTLTGHTNYVFSLKV